MKNKKEILESIHKLLAAHDCVVRIQREVLPDPTQKHDAEWEQFITSKRVTIIIVGTYP